MANTATAYIDGFNLYYGLKAAYGRKFLWLDLEALCASLLATGQQLTAVKYFTAPVRGAPDSLQRQQTYWNALAVESPTVIIERGRFQRKSPTCRSCGNSWTSFEEKESDVALAVSVVEDAATTAFDTAILVSGDSDLCPALSAVRRLHPGAKIVSAFPPKRTSDKLKRITDANFTISKQKLANAMLPESVYSADGKVFSRPPSWK